jgi:hypothetical protein
MRTTKKNPETKKVYIFDEPYDNREQAKKLAELNKNKKVDRYDIKR